jgi:gamma-butyrobetaine dioxygenase
VTREPGQDQIDGALNVSGLHPAWLRDNCQCAGCRDPVSGQRLISISEQAEDVTLDRVIEVPGGVQVTFGPDGHQSVFTWTWLRAESAVTIDSRCEDAKRLWSASDYGDGPPSVSWRAYTANDEVRFACLRQLLTSGFMLLRGVPCRPGAVLAVAGSFGYVRDTNYGQLFDVRIEASPANLAFTGLPIGPHTDNPYRDPVPTLQLLHCLANAAGSGTTAGPCNRCERQPADRRRRPLTTCRLSTPPTGHSRQCCRGPASL